MKQVNLTINVSDNKFNQLIEFLSKNFGAVSIDDANFEVPEWHKEIVRERIKTAKKEDFIPWEEARKQLKFKKKD